MSMRFEAGPLGGSTSGKRPCTSSAPRAARGVRIGPGAIGPGPPPPWLNGTGLEAEARRGASSLDGDGSSRTGGAEFGLEVGGRRWTMRVPRSSI
eukprot:2019877-Pyramimonas_sp.AAC.1